MEHSDHQIMTEWHGEQWDFQNSEKTMEHILITGSWLDGMENSEIFITMKRQWNILITGSWLDGMENSEIFITMKRQWNILITGSWLDGMENSEIFITRVRYLLQHPRWRHQNFKKLVRQFIMLRRWRQFGDLAPGNFSSWTVIAGLWSLYQLRNGVILITASIYK
jgi:hypothetical protein